MPEDPTHPGSDPNSGEGVPIPCVYLEAPHVQKYGQQQFEAGRQAGFAECRQFVAEEISRVGQLVTILQPK